MLYIASDHNGFTLKKYLVRLFKTTLKIEAIDLGAEKFEEDDDYPDYAFILAKKVAENPDNRGILICGSGQGVCIVANKVKGIRAMLGYSIESAEMARKDDDVNVLCLPGRVLSEEHAIAIVKKFLTTDFKNQEKYIRRVKKIEELEKIV